MKVTKRARRAARRLFRLCALDGRLDEPRALQVAQRLTSSKRRGALAILSAFHRLVRLDRDRRTALIESAAPLPDGTREDVEARLAHVFGPGLHTAFIDNPGLIGGVRITVGSDVYDGSVRGRLRVLESRL